jgi:hypothetical protein
MGGFLGHDQVLTPYELANLVESGELRDIYWNAVGGRSAGARKLDGQAGLTS